MNPIPQLTWCIAESKSPMGEMWWHIPLVVFLAVVGARWSRAASLRRSARYHSGHPVRAVRPAASAGLATAHRGDAAGRSDVLGRWSEVPFLRVLTARRQRREARAYEDRVAGELPYVIEALRMCLRVGYSATAAWSAVSTHTARYLEPDMASAELVASSEGVSMVEGWLRLAEAQPAWRPTVMVLRDSHRLGSASDLALGAVADEARRSMTARQRARIQALSVKLLFPLLICILPAFICLAIVPSLAGLADGASMNLSGG